MKPNTTNIRYYELTASEFDWKVSENKTVKAWGFNNSIPGPVINASKGETLVIKVKNNLTEPTVVHWHGIQLPSSMDGTDDAQMPIEPGEAFEYSFIVPDAEHSGIIPIKMKRSNGKRYVRRFDSGREN
jgi:FtsP/CotA-like multicopper oxidase with cupredoxin domain